MGEIWDLAKVSKAAKKEGYLKVQFVDSDAKAQSVKARSMRLVRTDAVDDAFEAQSAR